jgi:hypothetical protein
MEFDGFPGIVVPAGGDRHAVHGASAKPDRRGHGAFRRQLPGRGSARGSPARAGLPREDRYQANDDLPEYPPLRYTPFWVAIYGLMYEEILRDTFDRLVELHGLSEGRVWPSLRRILRRGKETGILTQRLTRFDNLEHLRLPVTRPLAERIMKSKSQDQVARTIVEFRVGHSIIATGAMLIAMLGLFVALASLLVGIPSALQAIRGPDSAAPTDTAASR